MKLTGIPENLLLPSHRLRESRKSIILVIIIEIKDDETFLLKK